MTEDQLQRAVVKYLHLAKPKGMWFAIHNNPRSARDGARLKAMGLKAGVPDLVFIHYGGRELGLRVLCIELKTATGRQSPAQKKFEIECVRECGLSSYLICRSIDDVMVALKVWGFL